MHRLGLTWWTVAVMTSVVAGVEALHARDRPLDPGLLIDDELAELNGVTTAGDRSGGPT